MNVLTMSTLKIRIGGACRAGAHPACPLTARDGPAARSRRGADRPEAIRQPRRACGHAVAGRGRDSAGRRTRRPQGPRRPVRPRSGRALQAQTAQDPTPVCGRNPKEQRRRAAGARGFRIGSSANRRAAPRDAPPNGAASRPASRPRRGADPARGFPDPDRRRRVLRARVSDRGPCASGARFAPARARFADSVHSRSTRLP